MLQVQASRQASTLAGSVTIIRFACCNSAHFDPEAFFFVWPHDLGALRRSILRLGSIAHRMAAPRVNVAEDRVPPATSAVVAQSSTPTSPLGRVRGAAQTFHTGYSFEGLDGADWQQHTWARPSVDKARDNFKAQLFQGGDAPLFSTSIADLSSLGVGVSLHFRLLQYLTCFFVFASVLSVPSLLFAFAGGRLDTVAMAVNLDVLRVSELSLANVGLPTSLNGTVVDDVVLRPWGSLSSAGYSHRTASIVIMGCDLVMILAYFAFVFCLRLRITDISGDLRQTTLNAADYAVYVTGLPPHATEDEVRMRKCMKLHTSLDVTSSNHTPAQVRVHFSELYNLHKPDWTFKSKFLRCCWSGRKAWQRRLYLPAGAPVGAVKGGIRDENVCPVQNTSNTRYCVGLHSRSVWLARILTTPLACSNPAYQGSWVAEVTMALANGDLILRYQVRRLADVPCPTGDASRDLGCHAGALGTLSAHPGSTRYGSSLR